MNRLARHPTAYQFPSPYSCQINSRQTPNSFESVIRYFHVDAFAQTPFAGNPAGVCPLEAPLPAALMQQIAAENSLAETAFFVPCAGTPAEFDLRWFTPVVEIDLCGHATLAAAHVLFQHLGFAGAQVIFHSQSGPLRVARDPSGRLVLDFPSRPPQLLPEIPAGLGPR